MKEKKKSKKDELLERQNERQAKFPKDRIAFIPSAASMDIHNIRTFISAVTHEKSTRSTRASAFFNLRAEVCKSNYLFDYFKDGMIPAEMMLNELRITGWISDKRYKSLMEELT